MKRICRTAALSLIIVAGSAHAQLTTPPPKANPETPEFTPPDQQPAPVARPQAPDRNRPNLSNPGTMSKVPDVEYRKLAQIGEDGKIIRFDVPLDFEALRNNPFVGGKRKAIELMPMLVGRRYRMEQIVVDNLDFIIQIEAGLLDNLQLDNPEAMKLITDVMTPLVPPKSITLEMFDRQLLSRVQKDMNLQILGEYQTAIMSELTEQDANTGLTNFMKYIMGESLKESTIAFEGMLAEATWRMKEVVEKAGLADTAAASALLGINGSANDEADVNAAKAIMVRDAWDSLDLKQKQAFLNAVRETREDPHAPPVRMLDLSNPDLIEGEHNVEIKMRKPGEAGDAPAGDGG